MSKQARPPKSASLTQELRWFLQHAKETPVEISRRIGVHHASLYRFSAATRGLSDDAMDRLAKHLNLRLVQDRK